MSDDYCVYARNVLGRISSIGNPTSGFTSSFTTSLSSPPPVSGDFNTNTLLLGAILALLLIFTMLQKSKKN